MEEEDEEEEEKEEDNVRGEGNGKERGVRVLAVRVSTLYFTCNSRRSARMESNCSLRFSKSVNKHSVEEKPC